MLPTIPVSKNELTKLPDEVLRLIGMGHYTLYKIRAKKNSRAEYALRTGASEIFLLTSDGEPLTDEGEVNFEIQEKVLLEDVSVKFVVPNFNTRSWN
jgi:hypothetical protein